MIGSLPKQKMVKYTVRKPRLTIKGALYVGASLANIALVLTLQGFSKVFGWGAFQGIQEAHQAANPEAARRKEAEELIKKEGKGVCSYCQEEIVRNEVLEIWESEFMLGFCGSSKDKKHHPKVIWTAEEGVHNA